MPPLFGEVVGIWVPMGEPFKVSARASPTSNQHALEIPREKGAAGEGLETSQR